MKTRKTARTRAGFTLSETLMAVLILAMVTAIVAAGLPSAKNAYERAVSAANAQTMLTTAVNTLRSELGTAINVDTEENGITYDSAVIGARVTIFRNDNNVLMMKQAGDADSNGWALVEAPAQSGNLSVTCSGSLSVSDGVITFTDLDVTNGSETQGGARLSSLSIRSISSKGR